MSSKSDWTEHKSPDGRLYYYNKSSGQSVWEKPDELKTEEEKALPTSPWKEHVSDTGKKYYYNSITKQSVWEMPKEHQEFLERMNQRSRSGTPSKESDGRSEAEAAFMKLLRDSGVTPAWSWDQTTKAISSHEAFRALKTSAERKQVFRDYIDELRREEKEEKRLRVIRSKENFRKLLEDTPEIGPSTRWKKAAELISSHSAYREIDSEREREQIFENYIEELKRKEKERSRQKKKELVEKFEALLKANTSIRAETPWSKAREILMDDPEYRAEPDLNQLDLVDQLVVYEDYIVRLEKEREEKLTEDREQRRRAERKNRDAFKNLLAMLKSNGKVGLKTKWNEIYPLIRDDPRLLALLSQPGSSPLDLFRDMIDDLEDQAHREKKMVKEIFKDIGFVVTPETTYDEFAQQFASSQRLVLIDPIFTRYIYESMISKAASREKDAKKSDERRMRKKVQYFKDLLRNAPSVKEGVTWPEIRKEVAGHADFEAIESEEHRMTLFQELLEELRERGFRKSDDEDERKRSGSKKEKKRHRSKRHDRSSGSESDGERSKRHKGDASSGESN